LRIEETKIKEFINSVVAEYENDIYISYDYIEDTDSFYIWHNNYDLEFNNHTFANFIGKNLCSIFYEHGIFNILFSYDRKRAKDIEIYCVIKDILLETSFDKIMENITRNMEALKVQLNTVKFKINDYVSFKATEIQSNQYIIMDDICMDGSSKSFINKISTLSSAA
jgi:hypothetical protein